jgi:hypothetical protein
VNIPKVDFLSMHAGAFSLYPEGSTIEFDACKVAQRAVSNFKKPVFLNDDGLDAYPQRNTNTTVESWAAAASVSCSGLDKGIAHFEHLEDGSEQDPAPVDCAPTTETRYIDCDSYNQLGDITGISNFCALAGSSCPALSATQYCDSVCY